MVYPKSTLDSEEKKLHIRSTYLTYLTPIISTTTKTRALHCKHHMNDSLLLCSTLYIYENSPFATIAGNSKNNPKSDILYMTPNEEPLLDGWRGMHGTR